MRDITNEKNNIRELQLYLRELHHDTSGRIPLVNPDGIYGSETRAAVMAYQELAGYSPTGTVDYSLWTDIYSDYKKAVRRREKPHPISPFSDDAEYEISSGEYSDIAAIVQFMLRALSNVYDNIDGDSPTGVFGEPSAKDIRTFQSMHGLAPTGRVDKVTWNALADAYNRSVNLKY